MAETNTTPIMYTALRLKWRVGINSNIQLVATPKELVMDIHHCILTF